MEKSWMNSVWKPGPLVTTKHCCSDEEGRGDIMSRNLLSLSSNTSWTQSHVLSVLLSTGSCLNLHSLLHFRQTVSPNTEPRFRVREQEKAGNSLVSYYSHESRSESHDHLQPPWDLWEWKRQPWRVTGSWLPRRLFHQVNDIWCLGRNQS